jgi:actin-related protein 8
VIARRNKSNKVVTTEEPFLVSCHKMDKEVNKSLSESQSSVMTTLSSCLTTSGHLRSTTNRDKLIDFNKRSKPLLMPKNSSNVRQWTQTAPKQDFIIGEEVLLLKPTEPFHIRWPIRRSLIDIKKKLLIFNFNDSFFEFRGRLNVNNGLGGSLTSVISDLESIWSLAIEKYLEIPLNQLNQYRVILIIPDVYNRNHVKCLIDLLLINLQFEGLIVIHEGMNWQINNIVIICLYH